MRKRGASRESCTAAVVRTRRGPQLAAARSDCSAHGLRTGNRSEASGESPAAAALQTLFFSAAKGNAFTTFRAGFAFTITVLPNTSRFPALVAGFVRVLILNN